MYLNRTQTSAGRFVRHKEINTQGKPQNMLQTKKKCVLHVYQQRRKNRKKKTIVYFITVQNKCLNFC